MISNDYAALEEEVERAGRAVDKFLEDINDTSAINDPMVLFRAVRNYKWKFLQWSPDYITAIHMEDDGRRFTVLKDEMTFEAHYLKGLLMVAFIEDESMQNVYDLVLLGQV